MYLARARARRSHGRRTARIPLLQGQRDYQEDTVAVYTTSSSFLGGVFDGHGGDEVSKELEKVLLGVSGGREAARTLCGGETVPRRSHREGPRGKRVPCCFRVS